MKHKIESFYFVSQFDKHASLKKLLLSEIDKGFSDPSELRTDEYYSDCITRFDWSQAANLQRSWVWSFIPHLNDHINSVAGELGYKDFVIEELWYQQYNKNDSHGWHIHGHNFSGVYYLELSNDGCKTQLVDPYQQNLVQTPDVKEGDIVLFPSHAIHRAPPHGGDTRRTVIAFNLTWKTIDPKVLKFLKEGEDENRNRSHKS